MAKSHSNVLLSDLSGILGGLLVVRGGRGGRTIVSLSPRRVRPRKGTPAQAVQRKRFGEAVPYAKAHKHLPEYVALAAARGVSAYNVAVADFLHPPQILGVDASAYLGATGQTLQINAVDDVKVATVKVTLFTDNDTVIEEGHATVSSTDPHLWIYTTTTDAPSASVKIQVAATDLAGQTTTQTTHT